MSMHGIEMAYLRKPVILDVDTGVDDALAVMLALNSPELEVKAITVSGGNVPLDQCALNTARVVCLASRLYGLTEVPLIAKGDDPPTERPDVTDAHGPDGLGGISEDLAVEGEEGLIREDAASLMRKLLEEAARERRKLAIVTTGPLTNLARWTRDFPDLLYGGTSQVISMGGAFFTCGNRSAVAEYNLLSDPEAAAQALAFCRGDGDSEGRSVPHVFVGLDVTHKVALRRSHLRDLIRVVATRETAKVILGMTRIYMDFYARNEDHEGCPLHDPLAVAMAIDPTFCRTESYHVEIETKGEHTKGMSIADNRPSRLFKKRELEKTLVCVDVDAPRFEELFLARVVKESV